ARHLALARSLGGEVVTTASDDVVQAMMRLAHQRNITQIVIGKPEHSWFREFIMGGSLVDRLVHASAAIDIYVVTGARAKSTEGPIVPYPTLNSGPNKYLVAIAAVAAVTVINLLAYPLIDYRAVALSLLFTVLVLAASVGRGPSLV